MGERIIAVIGALSLEAGHHDETYDVLQMARFGPHRRPERFPSAQSASRSRESRAQILLSLVTAPLTWRKPWRWLAGGRSRFPWREVSGCRYGERAREPVLQPDDDQWRRARQRVRHQGLGHPLQDGAAGAPQRAGPFWLAARSAGAAAAQPAAAAIAAGGEWDRGAGGGLTCVLSRRVALLIIPRGLTCRCRDCARPSRSAAPTWPAPCTSGGRPSWGGRTSVGSSAPVCPRQCAVSVQWQATQPGHAGFLVSGPLSVDKHLLCLFSSRQDGTLGSISWGGSQLTAEGGAGGALVPLHPQLKSLFDSVNQKKIFFFFLLLFEFAHLYLK